MAEYIEREAAVRAINSKRRPENSVAQNRLLALAVRDVFKIPAADAAPVRHGKWMKTIDNGCEMYRCDQCGSRVLKELYEYENPNCYCYHCGAWMEGGNGNA